MVLIYLAAALHFVEPKYELAHMDKNFTTTGSDCHYMADIIADLNEFRGTRPAQALSAAIFLGLGWYYLFFGSGLFALVIGILFPILGFLAVYKLIVGKSIVHLFLS